MSKGNRVKEIVPITKAVIPAKAGIHAAAIMILGLTLPLSRPWIPALAGMPTNLNFPRLPICYQPLALLIWALYIDEVGQPTMTLNAMRNRRYGPGGGTRRLHHFLPGHGGRDHRGRNRIDVRSKGMVCVRHDTTVIGSILTSANDNVALAAAA